MRDWLDPGVVDRLRRAMARFGTRGFSATIGEACRRLLGKKGGA